MRCVAPSPLIGLTEVVPNPTLGGAGGSQYGRHDGGTRYGTAPGEDSRDGLLGGRHAHEWNGARRSRGGDVPPHFERRAVPFRERGTEPADLDLAVLGDRDTILLQLLLRRGQCAIAFASNLEIQAYPI